MKQVVYWVMLSISARISEVTVLFLGVWGQIKNPDFNSLEFEGIRNEAGRNSFFLSAKKWPKAWPPRSDWPS